MICISGLDTSWLTACLGLALSPATACRRPSGGQAAVHGCSPWPLAARPVSGAGMCAGARCNRACPLQRGTCHPSHRTFTSSLQLQTGSEEDDGDDEAIVGNHVSQF